MTDYWPAVISAASGLVGSLGGVLVTHGHQRKTAREDRSEKRRSELRTFIVDLNVAYWAWDQQKELLIPMFALITSDREMSELANSDAAKRLATLYKEVNKNLQGAIAFVGDPKLQQALREFHDLWINAGSELDTLRKPHRFQQALAYQERLRRAMTDIRDQALPILQVRIVEDPHQVVDPNTRWPPMRDEPPRTP